MMTLKAPLLIASLVALTGCIPTIKKQWDVQPVQGSVIDAHTGHPIAGATVISRNNPSLIATTNSDGRFIIEEQTHVGFHLLMAASAMAHQVWQVSHPDYEYGIARTSTLLPPLSRELRTPQIPLFQQLPASPEGCPDFGYLMQLGEWKRRHDQRNQDMRFVETEDCHNPEAREAIYELWFPEPKKK